jgi:hypothetical protein
MADEKPRTLKLDMLELTVLESVEVSMGERTEPVPVVNGDANFAMQPMLPAESGYLPCE